MTVFSIILFIVLVIVRVTVGSYADSVPFLTAYLTPLTWLCVGAGVLMAVFIGIKIYKAIKH